MVNILEKNTFEEHYFEENVLKDDILKKDLKDEEWFTLDDISVRDTNDSTVNDKLYCISVDSPEKQFLIGNINIPTHNTDEGKAEDALKGEAAMIIGSIARLGRAAGVHLVIATQRPDAKIISGETKANLGVRINCGRTDSNASSMILGNGEGSRVKSNPRGRLYLRIFGSGNHGQGFFAEQSWIDDWLDSKGLNKDGSPKGSGKQSRLANVADMSQFEEGDLDSREGVDNSTLIEQIRDEETNEEFNEMMEENPTDDPNLGRPDLNGGETDMSKFQRVEEDFDQDLEDLINENNS